MNEISLEPHSEIIGRNLKKDKTDSSLRGAASNEYNYLTFSYFFLRERKRRKKKERERETMVVGVSEFHKGHRENWNCVCATGDNGAVRSSLD